MINGVYTGRIPGLASLPFTDKVLMITMSTWKKNNRPKHSPNPPLYNNNNMKQALPGKLAKLMVWYQDILVLNYMRHLGTRYWTSRYSILDISVLGTENICRLTY